MDWNVILLDEFSGVSSKSASLGCCSSQHSRSFVQSYLHPLSLVSAACCASSTVLSRLLAHLGTVFPSDPDGKQDYPRCVAGFAEIWLFVFHFRFTDATCAAIFDLAAVWGFGGALESGGRVDARRLFSELWREKLVTFGGEPLPTVGTIFDYTYDPASFAVCTWSSFVTRTKYLGIAERDTMVISTPLQVAKPS
jgi:hypothetical protein